MRLCHRPSTGRPAEQFCRGIAAALLLSAIGCGGNAANPVAPSMSPIVYEAGSGVSLPTVISRVTPVYTAAAIDARIQGSVLMSVVVLSNGTVGDVTVVRSLDTVFGLDAEAVKAAKQWMFNPGTKDGQAVAVRVSIEMTFTLR